MATEFELQPTDYRNIYTNITFDCITPDGPESKTIGNYRVMLHTLEFNEAARIQIAYAQYQHREGGEARDLMYPLVPLQFTMHVVGLGATPAIRLADLIAKSGALMRSIYNSNGYLKYKPDGLAAGVHATYYHYLQSAPPQPGRGARNYWGGVKASPDVDYIEGLPTKRFDVTLMTYPIATSDPETPISVLGATTLNNIGDGTNDYVTIGAASIDGDMPALVRLIAHPLTAGAAAMIGSLWVAKRTSGLGSFVASYFTGIAQVPAAVWSIQVDASRCNGDYYRCTPSVNNIVYAMRYTIADWASHQGRAAILIVARNNGINITDFDVYYRWAIANTPLSGNKKQLSSVGLWEPLLLGEIDLPETEMSAQEDLDLYIDICVVRTSSSGTFDLDCVKLIFTDEDALQVDAPVGIGTTHSFLLENFDEEVSHAIVQATDKLAYVCNIYGDMISLEPDSDNRLDVAWKRYRQIFEDSFDGYADFWQKIADFELDESWSAGTQVTAGAVEGIYALRFSLSTPRLDYSAPQSFTGFSDTDYVCGYLYSFPARPVTLTFYTTVSDWFRTNVQSSGWIKALKSSFSVNGSPSWSNITYITLSYAGVTLITIDDLRFVSADGDDATTYDDTGGVWDIYSGQWHVCELDGTSKAFGSQDGGYTFTLIHTDYGADVKYHAKVWAKNGNSAAGLVFRCSDGTDGSEDCYAFMIHTALNQLWLKSYVAGVASDVSAVVSYTLDYDTEYYIGVIVSGTSIQCFISTDVDTLWETTNRKFNVIDGTYTTGQCGLIAGGISRFTDVRLEGYADLHVPADQIQLSAYALYRTVYPFHES